MFGLISPARRNADYCRAYAHVCQSHRRHFGLGLLPFHSYESILLYLLSVDAGVVSLDDKAPVACCQLSRRVSPLRPADEAVSRFCAAFSTLLGFIKLRDDLSDSGSLRARILLRVFRGRFAEAFACFEALDPGFSGRIDRILTSHAALECAGGSYDLREFCKPTSDGFGYVFELLAYCWGRPIFCPGLETIGRAIGTAIICFDVAYDYDEDIHKKHFNPLPDSSHRQDAVNLAKACLLEAANTASVTFRDRSLASYLCRSVESSLLFDDHGQPCKSPSVFEEEVPKTCETAKAFGFVPVPVIAADNHDAQTICGLLCCCLCLAGASKGCCEWKGTITEKGPCGQTRTKSTRRRSGPCG